MIDTYFGCFWALTRFFFFPLGANFSDKAIFFSLEEWWTDEFAIESVVIEQIEGASNAIPVLKVNLGLCKLVKPELKFVSLKSDFDCVFGNYNYV